MRLPSNLRIQTIYIKNRKQYSKQQLKQEFSGGGGKFFLQKSGTESSFLEKNSATNCKDLLINLKERLLGIYRPT